MTSQTDAIARRFLQAWNAGGESIVDELAAPELVVSYTHFPEPLRGREAFKHALRQTHVYFPDLQITAEEVLTVGETAVVRWSYEATHQRGELFGVPAAGQRVEVHGITIYRVSQGSVREERGVVDNLALLTQLQNPQGSP